MIRIGIIGENYKNDACALKTFMTPQYESRVVFVPLGKSLSDGVTRVHKILNALPIEISKNELDAVIFMRDLDNEPNRIICNKWFIDIQKSISTFSIFFLVVMELEALILADIETFNKLYDIKGQYTKNPKHEQDPKQLLKDRTTKAKRKYDETHAFEIFTQLRFDIVYQKHKGEYSFQAFIDRFEEEFKLNPTTKERLKKEELEKRKGKW